MRYGYQVPKGTVEEVAVKDAAYLYGHGYTFAQRADIVEIMSWDLTVPRELAIFEATCDYLRLFEIDEINALFSPDGIFN